MNYIALTAAVLLSVVLCKALGLLTLTGFCWAGMKLCCLDPAQRDAWFASLSDRTLKTALAGSTLFASGLASLAAWGLLVLWHVEHAGVLALVLFAARLALTWVRYQREGRAHLQQRVKQLRQTALGDKAES